MLIITLGTLVFLTVTLGPLIVFQRLLRVLEVDEELEDGPTFP